jgi:hypothetical protein
MAPQAGIAVYVRGDIGTPAAARIYDDSDPLLPATRCEAAVKGL